VILCVCVCVCVCGCFRFHIFLPFRAFLRQYVLCIFCVAVFFFSTVSETRIIRLASSLPAFAREAFVSILEEEDSSVHHI
jgi:hypothetical protein